LLVLGYIDRGEKMKQLIEFEEHENDNEKNATLTVAAYALKPREHISVLTELEAEGVSLTYIDADSVRGELKAPSVKVKKALAELLAVGWKWNA